MSFIHSIKSGVPSYAYSQLDFYNVIAPRIPERVHKIFERILDGSEIRKRHFCTTLDHIIELTVDNKTGDKYKLWQDASDEFFTKQTEAILSEADISADGINAICTSTTSGFVTPGIDVVMMEKFKYPLNTFRIPLFGFGCSGGMAAINNVHNYLEGNPTHACIIHAGEVCGTQYEDDPAISKLVSNSIFGDGFATVLMVGKEHELADEAAMEIISGKSHYFPGSGFAVGQHMSNDGIRTHVDYKLPTLIKKSAKEPLYTYFNEEGVNIDDIKHWVMHAGGPKVMQAFSECMEIDKAKLDLTLETYRNYGNQSGVSVLTAIDHKLQSDYDDGIGFMMGLGPGIHMEYTLCQLKNVKKSSHAISQEQVGINAIY